MENFDRENIDKLLEIHQIPPVKILCHTVNTVQIGNPGTTGI